MSIQLIMQNRIKSVQALQLLFALRFGQFSISMAFWFGLLSNSCCGCCCPPLCYRLAENLHNRQARRLRLPNHWLHVVRHTFAPAECPPIVGWSREVLRLLLVLGRSEFLYILQPPYLFNIPIDCLSGSCLSPRSLVGYYIVLIGLRIVLVFVSKSLLLCVCISIVCLRGYRQYKYMITK